MRGAHGVYAAELEFELGTVEAGAQRPLPDHGAALGLRDRFYIQIKNRGHRQLFAHVLNIGLQGTVALLTRKIAPAGISIQGGQTFVLGKRADGALPGIGIGWPAGLPRAGFPRVDEYFVIVTSSMTDLSMLETPTVRAQGARRGGGTKLQALLAQLHDGATRDAGDLDETE